MWWRSTVYSEKWCWTKQTINVVNDGWKEACLYVAGQFTKLVDDIIYMKSIEKCDFQKIYFGTE